MNIVEDIFFCRIIIHFINKICNVFSIVWFFEIYHLFFFLFKIKFIYKKNYSIIFMRIFLFNSKFSYFLPNFFNKSNYFNIYSDLIVLIFLFKFSFFQNLLTLIQNMQYIFPNNFPNNSISYFLWFSINWFQNLSSDLNCLRWFTNKFPKLSFKA